MRKLFLTAAFAASLTISYAQDLKDVQEKISKGKYDEAKEKLDKFFAADPKNANNANAYYYKGQIYGYFAQTDTAGKLTYDAAKESFDAYKKALEIDPKNPLMTIDQNLGLFQLFDMHYNRAIKQYNNKNYDVAFASFQKAIDLQDFLKSKKFSLSSYTPPVLDTQLINLTASSAFLAKKEDVAVSYFERLANARVSGPEYKEIYALIVQHYLKKKDDANATKYINIGKELYKDDDYWLSLEFGNVGNDRDAKLKRYEELLQKYPSNAALALDYAIEQFNYTYVWDKKPTDYTERQTKLQSGLDKALQLNTSSPLAYFIESQHYYSQVFDLEDAKKAVVGNTPAAAAKRKDLTAQVEKKYDDLAAASQKAFDLYAAQTELKATDKTNYRKVTDQLIDYYSRKKMNDKVTFYQGKKAAIK